MRECKKKADSVKSLILSRLKEVVMQLYSHSEFPFHNKSNRESREILGYRIYSKFYRPKFQILEQITKITK